MKPVTLYLTGKKGEVVLEVLTTQFPGVITAVVGSRDEGVKDGSFERIQACCRKLGITWLDRKNEGNNALVGTALAAGWRWLLPLRSDRRIYVMHDSLLPRYRGFNPLVSMLINGEDRMGVSLLLATEEFDKGPIAHQLSRSISYPCRIQDAINQVSELYAEMSCWLADHWMRGIEPVVTPQDESLATYSLWRDDLDYWINWQWDSGRICRMVGAVGPPYSGARSLLNGEPVRILEAEEEEDLIIENRCPGKVLFLRRGMPSVVCGQGMLRITRMEKLDFDAQPILLSKLRSRFSRPEEI